jgi:hypothetical protein
MMPFLAAAFSGFAVVAVTNGGVATVERNQRC